MNFGLLSLMLVMLVSCGGDFKTTRAAKNGGGVTREEVNPESEGTGSLNSHLYRVAGTKRLSVQDETKLANSLPVGYSDTPSLENSDDGIQGNAVSRAARPIVECGLTTTFTTLAQRIRDCASKNPNQYDWNGIIKATAGEGTWKLVARGSNGNSEIWLDETTGFIWSPVLSTASNWCQAAGNTEGPMIEGGIDCSSIHGSITRCDGASILGIPASEISWRLPTRNDFLQADLNGARFVLPQSNIAVWTATVNSVDRENAWSIVPRTGILTAQPRSDIIGVRCLGRRIK